MEGGLSLGYLNRLESHERRGEAEPIYEEGLNHETGAYWSEGPQGHDGMTRDEEERDDWLYALRMEGLTQPGDRMAGLLPPEADQLPVWMGGGHANASTTCTKPNSTRRRPK